MTTKRAGKTTCNSVEKGPVSEKRPALFVGKKPNEESQGHWLKSNQTIRFKKPNRMQNLIRIEHLRASALSIVCATALFSSTPRGLAQGVPELNLISGSSSISLFVSTGTASYSGTVGAWNYDVTTGFVAPTDGPGSLDLDSISLSTAGTSDSLTLIWTAVNYTQDSPYLATVGGTISPGTGAVFSSYYGLLPPTTPLAPFISETNPAGNTVSFSGSSSGAAVGTTYGLTEEVVVNGPGTSSQVGFDYSLNSVPEPSTPAMLLGGGLAAVGYFRSRKAVN
jgi:hypothetical protein